MALTKFSTTILLFVFLILGTCSAKRPLSDELERKDDKPADDKTMSELKVPASSSLGSLGNGSYCLRHNCGAETGHKGSNRGHGRSYRFSSGSGNENGNHFGQGSGAISLTVNLPGTQHGGSGYRAGGGSGSEELSYTKGANTPSPSGRRKDHENRITRPTK